MQQTDVDSDNKPQLLYLEDDPVLSETMTALLEMSDFNVFHANNTEKAVAHINKNHLVPHLILADKRLLYGECGIESVTTIRNLLSTEVPAILLTGDSDISNEDQKKTPLQRILLKPVDIDKLIREIQQLLA
ncbi:response regulator [Planctobacterium marinum]|uniref:Response regulatory domain-containing protein n=1 Tax=Planctobacterium marinum TaxID=1631968 RepID=A0AA48KR22_9ALTE|nr:hypothetical protein MACH26_25890 [Planctobacterium marinum]